MCVFCSLINHEKELPQSVSPFLRPDTTGNMTHPHGCENHPPRQILGVCNPNQFVLLLVSHFLFLSFLGLPSFKCYHCCSRCRQSSGFGCRFEFRSLLRPLLGFGSSKGKESELILEHRLMLLHQSIY